MTNFYERIEYFDTDTFWTLAVMSVRYAGFEWHPAPLFRVLNRIGYTMEDGQSYTEDKVLTLCRNAHREGWLQLVSGGNYLLPLPAARAVRQYLLVHFRVDAVDLKNDVLKQFRGRGALSHVRDRPSALEKQWSQAYHTKKDVVTPLLLSFRVSSGHLLEPVYPDLKAGGSVYGTSDQIDAAALFLPPYPAAGYLADIPRSVRFPIVFAFALRPHLFHPDAHADLWQNLEEVAADNEQLLVRAAINFLPGLPPGADAGLWERFADLKVVADWTVGRREPYEDHAALGREKVNTAWLFRALVRLGRREWSVPQLREAFSRLEYIDPDTLRYVLVPESESEPRMHDPERYTPFELIVNGLAILWAGGAVSTWETALLKDYHNVLAPFPWLRAQLTALEPHRDGPAADDRFRFFNNLLTPAEKWESFLRRLEDQEGGAAGADKVEEAKQGDIRIAYVYEPRSGKVEPKEQTFGKNGWTRGRKFSWEHFFNKVTEEEDRVVAPALLNYYGQPLGTGRWNSWDNQPHKIDTDYALYLLAGHPRVFEGDAARLPLSVTAAQPQLLVEHDEADNLQVHLDPPGLAPGYTPLRTAPGKLTVYFLSEQQAAITSFVPRGGLTVPASAAPRFERVLPSVRRSLPVVSSTDWKDQNLPQIEGQPFPCFHLVPLNKTEHRLEVFIKPVADQAFYYRPGAGMRQSLIATEEAGRAVLNRDLEAETAAVANCLADCPALAGFDDGIHDLLLTEDQHVLEALTELNTLVKAERAVLEYPKGQRLRLGETVDDEQLRVQVGSGKDWFRVDVGLQLNEERVIDFELILEGLRNKDKFVRIGENEFLTLTDGLRDRLRKMDGLLHESRGKMELAPLAGTAFAEALEGLDQVETDLAWRNNLNRMAKAERFVPPPPPGDFRADLRDYQLVGYRWLLRLANWGVGACLADDMGLGKTVQALAVLTQRAEDGPALVIAPASVIRNWQTETERFAPTLTPRLIGSAAEAEAVLADVRPGVVVLLSFGLLTYIADELLNTSFRTLVVDEAQAIKNPTTQRARLVRDLAADWKIATTGTPIENNLAELWSLFRFLNPGLFGSYQRFRQQYELPIVAGNDRVRAEQLRRLVRPFILRRRKEDVLTELPPKTEIVRTVEPGPEEKSLYEALRRKALRDIDSADAKRRRFIVLQQLTQLRQAACNPKLLNKRSKVPSAKLGAVGETIREILDGGHKALVFSQFVGHLQLVEKWVKKEKIAYQYLDGSTPGKVRQKRVEAFQDGTGDLFLISLKAGGTGLNLTAADYVLHLDPWWNPAVEDQASDRAHRMGQTKHVTVYRFVTAGTIEEQILELHAEKRDLADRLLEGTDEAGKLSVDDVVELLRTE